MQQEETILEEKRTLTATEINRLREVYTLFEKEIDKPFFETIRLFEDNYQEDIKGRMNGLGYRNLVTTYDLKVHYEGFLQKLIAEKNGTKTEETLAKSAELPAEKVAEFLVENPQVSADLGADFSAKKVRTKVRKIITIPHLKKKVLPSFTEIYELQKQNVSVRKIAEKFAVNEKTIRNIIKENQ